MKGTQGGLGILLIGVVGMQALLMPLTTYPNMKGEEVDKTLGKDNEVLSSWKKWCKDGTTRDTAINLKGGEQRTKKSKKDYNEVLHGHGTGLIPPAKETLQKWTQHSVSRKTNAPLAAADLSDPTDWSETKYFPPIGDQGNEGSCTAWATTYYTKTFQEAREHDWNLSEVEWQEDQEEPTAKQGKIFSPDFVYHQINGGEDKGSSIADAMNLLIELGASTWEMMPNSDTDSRSWPDESAWREAPLYRSKGGRVLWCNNTTQFTRMKEYLANGTLSTVMLNGYGLYDLKELDNMGGEIFTTDNEHIDDPPNHAQVIVGFNDSVSYHENGETHHGAFRVANSWGKGWAGDSNGDGKYWISYNAMKKGLFEYEINETTIRSPIAYSYSPLSGYTPQLLSVFKIDHLRRSKVHITVGAGTPSNPMVTKGMYSYLYQRGGRLPFPDNKMVLDVTEFQDDTDASPDDLYLNVTDKGAMTGTVEYFATENYSDYRLGQEPDERLVNYKTPRKTKNDRSVFLTDLEREDTTRPHAKFTSPDDGDTVSGDVSIKIEWNDTHPSGGMLFINSEKVVTWNTTGNQSYVWDTSGWKGKNVNITFKAQDKADNIEIISIQVKVKKFPLLLIAGIVIGVVIIAVIVILLWKKKKA